MSSGLVRDLSSLQFRIESFEERHLPLVASFSERYWSRPRTASYYRWRYLECQSFSKMFLALTDDECLGMVFAFRKSYLIAGRPTPCLEIFDWHSLPGLRGSGVGIRVIRAMMREGARLFGIGGTPDAVKALPAMGWQTVGEASTFELPLAGEVLEGGLRQFVPFRVPGERLVLNAVTRTWFKPRRRAFEGRVIPVSVVGSEVESLYVGDVGYDVVQIPARDPLRWMTAGYSGVGGFRYWYFVVGNKLRGWALTRVYDTEQGREAAIVDVFAPTPETTLYAWMISEVTTAVSGERPRIIRARATCPHLQAALRANRFRAGSAIPLFTWPKGLPADSRIHITLNHMDAPMRPYPHPGTETVFRDD